MMIGYQYSYTRSISRNNTLEAGDPVVNRDDQIGVTRFGDFDLYERRRVAPAVPGAP